MRLMINKLTEKYFNYVGNRFPVMCASDEFHFVPRAESAEYHHDRLDSLEEGLLQDTVKALKKFEREVVSLRQGGERGLKLQLEEEIDLGLVAANIAGILIEVEKKEIFRTNPLLYLKIALIGLDQALNKPAESPVEMTERISGRLRGIPELLAQGRANLSLIPASLHRYALAMIVDCGEYLENEAISFTHRTKRGSLLGQEFHDALEALDRFREFLLAATPLPDSHFPSDTLHASLRDHFMFPGSLEEIFDIAVRDWNENLEKLDEIGRRIKPGKSWQEIYRGLLPGKVSGTGLITRYRKEAENIADFFEKQGFLRRDECTDLVITETPVYLRSVRAAASFAASLTSRHSEADFFYITTHRVAPNKPDAGVKQAARLHREHKFLTAHETVPGHYLLDSIRRNLRNPVRRQIESPLFYEGWASYAETLLADYGYVTDPRELLTDFRRRLWRAARCQIDSGLPTGKITRKEALDLLKTVGFSRQEGESQISRYGLNPGYQLCYCLGSYEIREIRNRHMGRLGDRRFYELLLYGGEIPFQFVEKRMEIAG